MAKKTIAFSLLSLLASTSFAQEEKYKIRQIISSKNLVVVEASSETVLPSEKIFLATFADNTQCSLKLVGQNKNLLTMDSSDCDSSKKLVLNLMIEPSLHTVEETKPAPAASAKPVADSPTPAKKSVSPNMTHSIEDLSYTPAGGEWALESSFSMETSEFSLFTGSTFVSDSKTRTSRLSALVGYGFTDKFSMTLGMGLVPGQTQEISTSTDTYFSKGLEDPTIAANYRIVRQSDAHAMDVILMLGFTPKTFEAKSSTDNSDGTVASGRNQVIAALGTYKKFSSAELGVVLTYQSLWSGNRKNAETNVETELGTYDATSLRLHSQFKLTENFYLQAGLGIQSFSAWESKNLNTNAVTRYGSYSTTGVQLGARFVVVPKKAILDFDVNSDVASSVEMSVDSTKAKLKDVRNTVASAAVRYEF